MHDSSPESSPLALYNLLDEISACRHCAAALPLGPRPVVSASREARILITGQAPGTRVHQTGIPWNDPSGDRLRDWLGMDRATFYDTRRIAIMPMGFCYPGRGQGGDQPPRPECAPLWHARLLAQLPSIKLTLLIGQYAQAYYLPETKRLTMRERLADWRRFQPDYFPLVHPSPRNRLWLRRNPWFEEELVPALRAQVWEILSP